MSETSVVEEYLVARWEELREELPDLGTTPKGAHAIALLRLVVQVQTAPTQRAILESWEDLAFGIPVLLAVCVAHTVGGRVSENIYSRIARNKKLPHWPSLVRTESNFLAAFDVMVPLVSAGEALRIRGSSSAEIATLLAHGAAGGVYLV